MFWKIFQFSLFQCLKDAFVLLTFQFQVYSTLGKQLSFFRAKISGFCLFTHKQAFAAGVRRTYTIPTCGAQRPVADDFSLNCTGAMQRGRQQKKPDMCWYKRGFLNFFVKPDVLFWKRSSFVYLEESVRVPSFVPSPLRHRCRSWRLMFLKSVSRLPDYPTLKNDSHEAWKCSVIIITRKKYFERPHTAVFRRQRLGTTPSTQIFKQDDRFGAKRCRLLLWSVREHLIRVVQRSAFVSTDKLWLSRLSFFGMDYSNARTYIWNHTCMHTHAIKSRTFSSAKNFVKSDRQAVQKRPSCSSLEFIFIKHRSALVCSSVVRSSLFWLSYIFTFMIEYFWSHTSGLWKKN